MRWFWNFKKLKKNSESKIILFSSIESKSSTKSARAGLSDIVESAFTTTISEKIEAITEKKDAERKDSKPPKELHGTSENFLFVQKRRFLVGFVIFCHEGPTYTPGIFHEARRAAREGSWNGHAWKSSASLVEKKLWAWRTSARSRVRILVSLKLYAYAEINCSSVFFPKKLWSSKSYVWMML